MLISVLVENSILLKNKIDNEFSLKFFLSMLHLKPNKKYFSFFILSIG